MGIRTRAVPWVGVGLAGAAWWLAGCPAPVCELDSECLSSERCVDGACQPSSAGGSSSSGGVSGATSSATGASSTGTSLPSSAGSTAASSAATPSSGAASSGGASASGVSAGSSSASGGTPGLLLAPGSLRTTEAGGSARLRVTLASRPLGLVRVEAFVSEHPDEAEVAADLLVFTPSDWSRAQFLKVTGSNDTDVDGDAPFRVMVAATSLTDPDYNLVVEVDGVNSDDDDDLFRVQPLTGLVTTEAGGKARFTVVLAQEPVDNVTVTLTTSLATEGTVTGQVTFRPDDWRVPQAVDVSGVDDSALDGDQPLVVLMQPAVSLDPTFNGHNPPDVSVLNADDDEPAVTLSPLQRVVGESEAASLTFTVTLSAAAASPVTIPLVSSLPSEAAASTAELVLPAGQTQATFTVVPVADDIDDGDNFLVIRLGPTTSLDARFQDLDPADAAVTVTNDDVAGVLRTPNALALDEGGTTTTTIRLGSRPLFPVTIPLRPEDGRLTVTPTQVILNADNWRTGEAVSVLAVDDSVRSPASPAPKVFLDAPDTQDWSYFPDPPDVTVTVTDNDTAGIVVTGPALMSLRESGTTQDTFTVQLATQPSGDVVVQLTLPGVSPVTRTPAALTFTPATWQTPQVVTVTADNNDLHDGTRTGSIGVAATTDATTQDVSFRGTTGSDQAVSVTDDDVPGVLVTTQGELATGEGGATATFQVRLRCQPTQPVTVAVDTDLPTEATVQQGASLQFTALTWNVDQPVVVAGVEDTAQDGPQAYLVTFSVTSADADFGGVALASLPGTNQDNDSAGYLVSPSGGLALAEGGSTTFAVRLNTLPTANVVINLSSSLPGRVSVSATPLTFTPGNYATAQTVTVSAPADERAYGAAAFTIVLAQSSTDATYAALDPADVTGVVDDNDTSGLVVSTTTLNTTEGGTPQTFTVQLASEPLGDVRLDVSGGNAAEGTVTPASLVFEANTWSTPQQVTVTPVNDAVADGTVSYAVVVAVAAASTAAEYLGVAPADVTVSNADNDTAGFNVSPTTCTTTEDGTASATITVTLRSQPLANVTIPVQSLDLDECTVSAATLVFTAADWSAPHTFSVAGVDDFVDDGNVPCRVQLGTPQTTDATYGALDPADVTATNTDNDDAAILVGPTNGTTSESGTGFDVNVRLGSAPLASVTVSVSSSSGNEATATPASLVFTESNWNVQQAVQVRGVNDDYDDNDQAVTVTVAVSQTSDPGYQGKSRTVAVTNQDDDTAGFTVSPVTGSVSETGTTFQFQVRLNSRPTAAVTIPVASARTAEGTVNPASLVFDGNNWSTLRAVTVTGVDDVVVDGTQSFAVNLGPTTSGDALYAAKTPPAVSMTCTDNDGAGYVVSPGAIVVGEAAAATSFTVRLTSQPTAGVTLAFSSSNTAEATVAPSLSFTTADWATPKSVAVTPVNDAVDDDDKVLAVTSTVSTTDTAYAAAAPPGISVTVQDDDTAAFTVSAATPAYTTEGQASATFTIRLASQPTADVTVPISSSDTSEGTVTPSSCLFTPASWGARTVTVTGVNDAIDDDDVAYSVVLGAPTTSDPRYAALDPADVSLANRDDADLAAIHVSATLGDVSEAGLTFPFTVTLGSEPTTAVVLTVNKGGTDDILVAPATFTLDSTNWSTGTTVTVSARDDAYAEGTLSYTLDLPVPVTTDPKYRLLDPANVGVTVADNDVPALVVSAPAELLTGEGGLTATFQVRLATVPLGGSVTVSVTSNQSLEALPTPTLLTFTDQTWNVFQSVTVTGQEDGQFDRNKPFQIALVPTGGGYGVGQNRVLDGLNQSNDRRVFLTASTYMGSGLFGPTGADSRCASDPAFPGAGPGPDGGPQTSAVFKALIMSSARSLGLDWVLQANGDYYRLDGTYIGSTNARRVLGFLLNASIGISPAAQVWTGIAVVGGDPPWVPGPDCGNWGSTMSGSGSVNSLGINGAAVATDSTSMNDGTPALCTASLNLYCVEQ